MYLLFSVDLSEISLRNKGIGKSQDLSGLTYCFEDRRIRL